MIEPTRRFRVLELFRDQDKLFRAAMLRHLFSGCSVAFGDQRHQFFRSFGQVSEGHTGRLIALADSARALLELGKDLHQRADSGWIWVDAKRQLFAIFIPEPGAEQASQEVWKKFLTQIAEKLWAASW